MKQLSKFLAVLLAVLMSTSVFCLPAFAEEAQDDPYAVLKEGTGYVAIGDSFARGFGASDHYREQIKTNDVYGNYECRNVDGSYPNRVAEAFGLYAPNNLKADGAQFWSLAHDAVGVAYILDLLGYDDGYRDEELTYYYDWQIERYETDLRYYGAKESFPVDYDPANPTTYGQEGEIMNVRELLANASLISIGLGQSDIIYKAQLRGLAPLMANEVEMVDGVLDIISRLYNYYDYWKGAYDLLLSKIKELNPDCKVVLVGTVNPIKNVILSDEFAVKIGSILNIIFDSMNTYTKECALKYGYMYIDINDVDTPSSIETLTITEMFALTGEPYELLAHPTQNGYKQIAEKIIETVSADLEMDSAKADFGFKAFFDAFIRMLKAFFANFFAC